MRGHEPRLEFVLQSRGTTIMGSTPRSIQRIGDVARELDIGIDTLRYYEKIGLLPRVQRARSGARVYSEADVSRLRFIRRAQSLGFSLEEIGGLLKMRADPRRARPSVRELTRTKLAELDTRLAEMSLLRNELRLLLNLCQAGDGACPIIENLETTEARKTEPARNTAPARGRRASKP